MNCSEHNWSGLLRGCCLIAICTVIQEYLVWTPPQPAALPCDVSCISISAHSIIVSCRLDSAGPAVSPHAASPGCSEDLAIWISNEPGQLQLAGPHSPVCMACAANVNMLLCGTTQDRKPCLSVVGKLSDS